MSAVEFKSPRDGSTLTFDVKRRWPDELEFNVAVKTPWFSGVAPATTYASGSPTAMFRAMANEWKGWSEAKTWSDIEGRVSFSAISDVTGHIALVVELTGQDYDSHLRVVLQYEAGQLEGMANEIKQLLG
ncbi:hypothetical protein FACS1894116_07840 [Betaproteobacteria bacterium]|nr:hypothetical protein FACS1894116_07840 [Betaproteobacteria bacterium]GHT97835.1 hypothetical protein FACS1894154_02100 [Betaproteobacteria bacterium]GHU30168.1 hypothetical protein FACS189497_09500 [Betaproteobacteria bacterium]